MKTSKKKEFNERMGKAKHYPRHQNLSKGGMVDRKHFDDGGGVGTTAVNSTAAPGGINQSSTQGGLFGSLTNQSQYQAQLAPTTQFNYAPTVGAASTGALNAGTVNNAIGAEQGLAGQYGQIAAGQGPNPALALLNQQTGQNVANTAALQAGQRGSSQNVGLLARQIGQTGAQTQQNAIANAANLQANQQLAALGQQANLQGQIAGQGLGEQTTAANVYGTALGGNNAQNNANIANYGQANATNAATSTANANAAQQTGGGIIGGIGSLLGLSHGGEVEKFDDGGVAVSDGANYAALGATPGGTPLLSPPLNPNNQPTLGVNTNLSNIQAPTLNQNNATVAQGGPLSTYSKATQGNNNQNNDPTGYKSLGSGIRQGLSTLAASGLFAEGGMVATGPHQSHLMNCFFAEGGNTEKDVKALVSAKEVYLDPHQVDEVVHRGADPMKIGHHFPGKDKVNKNSEKNDVIPVTLEDGGVVIPISITTHKEASEKGRKFVEKVHMKRHMKKPKGAK